MKNEPLTPPQNASPAFAQVILKACQSDADARFESASQMREALEDIVRSQIEPQENKTAKVKVADVRTDPNLTANAKDAAEETVLLDTATPQTYSTESSEETVLLEESSASLRPTPSVSEAKPKKQAKSKKRKQKNKIQGCRSLCAFPYFGEKEKTHRACRNFCCYRTGRSFCGHSPYKKRFFARFHRKHLGRNMESKRI